MRRAVPFALLLALPLALRCGGDEPADVDEDGYAEGLDCNDEDPTVNPDAEEKCNHVDDNCDGLVDANPVNGRTFYPDADADGYGATESGVQACAWTEGLVDVPGDCDDTRADVHPGAPEDECRDAVDYNCDGSVGYADADRDGWSACEDCDDSDPASHPGGTEVCDGRDNDCDHTADEEGTQGARPVYADDDGDSYGDPGDSREACSLPVGFVENDDDCDDADGAVHPGAKEIPDDGVDQDCDGAP